MGFSDILDALGQGLRGQSGGQGGGQGGGASPFANWTQPTGSGLSAYSANPGGPPPESSGLFQRLIGQPSAPSFNPLDGGNGLHAILMRLGVFH